MPRWFTEGLAVHEETQENPEWGDRITPDIVVALRDKKLLPVAEIDRGFVRPEYPAQVIVSYYEAGRICDYIQTRWSADKLLDMVHSFAHAQNHARCDSGKSRDVRRRISTSSFRIGSTSRMARPPRISTNGTTKLKDLVEQAKNKNYDEVIKEGAEVISLYPDYVYDANAYEFVAQAQAAKGDKKAAAAALTSYEKLGGHDPEALKELATLEEGLGDPKEAAATLDRINYIDPVDEGLHRHLGELWLAQQNYPWRDSGVHCPARACTRSIRHPHSSIWLRLILTPARRARLRKTSC